MADGAPVIGPTGTAQEKPKAPRKAKASTTRAVSSISFPYMDLDAAISVASAMLNAGGVALSRDQLAGTMNLSAGSGNFVTKVATARMFGLIANVQGKYELTDLGFRILDRDDRAQKQARSDAFLTIPLYRRVFDEFRGKPLPPRPEGLEAAFLRFGVAPKQKATARVVFDKSAKQGGFFANGNDRLIEPIIGGSTPGPAQAVSVPQIDESVTQSEQLGRVSNFPPFIQGLLGSLPEPGTNWTVEGRAKWLQTAANCFDLMYKGDGTIHVSAKSAEGAQPVSENIGRRPIGPEPVRS
ncbi:MAG: hypothetical protein KGJ66_07605 [Alphaproteobacteria bacterium]|nr:hypothetical protein [Alphaproteobacteria bacterium]